MLKTNLKAYDDMFDYYEDDDDYDDDCNGNCDECDKYLSCDDADYTMNSIATIPLCTSQNEIIDNFEKRLVLESSIIRDGKNIPSQMLLDPLEDGGVYFGKANFSDSCYVGKQQNEDGHIMIIGGPGIGKTSAIIIPTLYSWKGHIVIIDVKPKGNLLERCYQTGKKVYVFNPYKEDACGFDPFSFLLADGDDNLTRNSKELALALIAIVPGGSDRVWVEAAQNLLAGIIIYHVSIGSTFTETMKVVQLLKMKELIDMITNSDNENAKILISKLKNLPVDVLAGIGMDLTSLAILAADPIVGAALSNKGNENMIDWYNLNTSLTPSIIVLQLPEENLNTWEPMTRLLINQLIRTLQRRSDKYSDEGNLLPPVLVILEEFASIGKISLIQSGLATLRSRGVTFCLVIQDISQLDAIYGVPSRKSIFGTCSYKVILKVDEPESMEYCSKLTGSVIVPNRSISKTYKTTANEVESYSLQVNESREPVMFPYEFAWLKDIVLITPDGYYRIEKVPYYKNKEQPVVIENTPQIATAVKINN